MSPKQNTVYLNLHTFVNYLFPFAVAVVSMKLDRTVVRWQKQPDKSGKQSEHSLGVNKVPYRTGDEFFSREKSNADIADEARKWTVLVECWK